MKDEYLKELKQLKIKMIEAEKFAEKIPVFAGQILDYKYTGNENWIKFGEKYKDTYFGWDINRGLYQSDTSRNITNYTGKSYTEFLFNIYINCYSIFGHHHNFGLDSLVKKNEVFFYDNLNSTFYATDEQVISLLDKLNNWYIDAKKENKVLFHNKKIEEATKQKEKSEKELKILLDEEIA